MRKSIIKNYFLVELTRNLSAVFTAFKENKNLKGSIVRKNTTIKAILIAILTITSFATLNATEVHTHYFNGMNTEDWEADNEVRALKNLMKYGKYSRKMRNFNPELRYTSTNGKIMDSSSVVSGSYKSELKHYVEHADSYCDGFLDHRGCTTTKNDKINELIKAINDIKMDGYEYSNYANNRMNEVNGRRYMPYRVQIISYSRGNIVANAVQEYFRNGFEAKRINIASPTSKDYGTLFITTADWVIGKFTSGVANYHPDYYWYNLSKSERKDFKATWWYTFKMNRKYFDGEWQGHNLQKCYLNRKYGLADDIEKQIYKDYKALGGK